MKKLILSLSLLAAMLGFNACSTDVELYADYKDIPVIYGLLDASKDTTFIRINRAFSGNNEHPINANEIALIADSSNYPGKLRGYIVEYRGVGNNYTPTGDTLLLDTITIHNKQEGVFYSPDQKVYFTDNTTMQGHSVFGNNNNTSKYRYKLLIYKDDEAVSAETGLVGGESFQIITSQAVFNPEPNDRTKRIQFSAADNAVFYDVRMIFHYQESHNGGPRVDKQVTWSPGAMNLDDLGKEGQSYFVIYAENMLFNLLADTFGGDTVVNPSNPHVERFFEERPIEFIVTAGGDELYNYIQVNQQSGYSQTVPDYTNINGGFGVFSSRVTISRNVRLNSAALIGLYNKPWGFHQR